MTLALKPQQIPYDSPDSHNMFFGGPGKPFLATPGAIKMYGGDVLGCLLTLQGEARRRNGLDYLQVFEDPTKPEPLWFIEDSDGGAITALLPSEY